MHQANLKFHAAQPKIVGGFWTCNCAPTTSVCLDYYNFQTLLLSFIDNIIFCGYLLSMHSNDIGCPFSNTCFGNTHASFLINVADS